jgi:pimeloyl-ACP methyl ester carboxylesterase
MVIDSRRTARRMTRLRVLIGCAVLLVAAAGVAAAPRAVASSGFVVTRDGTHIYYEIAGAGSPTVVVSGGFLVRDALEPLTRRHRVVFFDARNRGRSDHVSPDRISLEYQIEDVEDLREALGIERMVLLGWSGMGKEMAMYTLRHPERVDRLLQVAPVPPIKGDFMQRMMDARMARMDRAAAQRLDAEYEAGKWKDDPAGYCRAYRVIERGATFVDPANASAYPDTCRWPNEWPANLWPTFGALVPTIESADPTAALSSLDVPRLVIVGANDAIPREGFELWVKGYDDACLLVLPEAGHWVFVEAADAFFPAVEAFLGGVWPEGAAGRSCGDALTGRESSG